MNYLLQKLIKMEYCIRSVKENPILLRKNGSDYFFNEKSCVFLKDIPSGTVFLLSFFYLFLLNTFLPDANL